MKTLEELLLAAASFALALAGTKWRKRKQRAKPPSNEAIIKLILENLGLTSAPRCVEKLKEGRVQVVTLDSNSAKSVLDFIRPQTIEAKIANSSNAQTWGVIRFAHANLPFNFEFRGLLYEDAERSAAVLNALPYAIAGIGELHELNELEGSTVVLDRVADFRFVPGDGRRDFCPKCPTPMAPGLAKSADLVDW